MVVTYFLGKLVVDWWNRLNGGILMDPYCSNFKVRDWVFLVVVDLRGCHWSCRELYEIVSLGVTT